MAYYGKKVNGTVQSKTERFFDEDSSWSKAALAKLRRGIGKEIGELPDVLEYVLMDFPDDFDQSWERERAENAVYTALTLFAFHQQGKKNFMGIKREDDDNTISLGKAMRSLIQRNPENETAVKRRFDKILSADDLKELAVHTRGAIGLLKTADISLDYGAFAEALYRFQLQEGKRGVILDWAQDYYRIEKSDEEREIVK